MSAGTAMGISTTLISTDQQAPMGFIHTTPAGTDGTGAKQWIYTSITAATTAGGLPLGTAVVKPAAGGYNNASLAALGDLPGAVIGVSQALWDYAAFTPAATQLYGFVLRSGAGEALDGGGMVTGVGTGLIPTAAGELTAAAGVTDTIVGMVTAVAPGIGGLMGVWLDCRG